MSKKTKKNNNSKLKQLRKGKTVDNIIKKRRGKQRSIKSSSKKITKKEIEGTSGEKLKILNINEESYKNCYLDNIFSKIKSDSQEIADVFNNNDKSNNKATFENHGFIYPENLYKSIPDFELKYNTFLNPMNKNLYISKSSKFDKKKANMLIKKILDKGRKFKDNKDFDDMELIFLIYTDENISYSNHYKFKF